MINDEIKQINQFEKVIHYHYKGGLYFVRDNGAILRHICKKQTLA